MSKDLEVDPETGGLESDECSRKSPEKLLGRVGEEKQVKTGEGMVGAPVKAAREADKTGGCGKSGRKEKRKKSASKPPRPPRGPSLDAADQKLIKEIAELAMLKRARIERMRALKKMKAAKAASSASSSSLGNAFATLLTIIFCFVIIFQGMSSNAASKSFRKSPLTVSVRVDGGLVSANGPNGLVLGHSSLPDDGASLLRLNRKMSLHVSPK
ncbi:PREDICTED: uncharacterized protein LOC104820314 [Tarenaya hassleriana]|uniref:uncharacterized protein LOC104820314 n=1 Tax=Tarenaya hassleriana TaxID=28532 RepID=UPI00053C0E7C|nr:PREDICTED: uncharacterized protein LOC104820314 [Tarenaya hassleriana]